MNGLFVRNGSLGGLHSWVAHGGSISAKRYFRADMQIRPYHLHKLDGASGYVRAMTILFQQAESQAVLTGIPPIRL